MKEENKEKTTTTRKKSTSSVKKNTKSVSTKKKVTQQTPKKTPTTAKKKTATTKKTNSLKVEKEPQKEILEEKKEAIQTVVESTMPEVKEEVVEKKNNEEEFTKAQENTLFALRVIAILLATILLLVTCVKLFMEVRENTYSARWENKSYLTEKSYAKNTTCQELSNIVNGEEKFVLVTNFSEEEFELEKDLAKLIKEYHLEDKFYVYPLDESCREQASLDLQVEQFTKVPAIYYYRNGLLNYKVEREDDKMIESADFQKLLDIYEFKKGE